MKRNWKEKQNLQLNYKEFNNPFVAPQNSFNERNEIPRYFNYPFLKPSNSAPPTIHPTPNVSREVSKDVISNASIHNKNVLEQKRIQTLFEEPGKESPRHIKTARTISNRLQARLYNNPSDADVFKTIKLNEKATKGNPNKPVHPNVHNRPKKELSKEFKSIISSKQNDSLLSLNEDVKRAISQHSSFSHVSGDSSDVSLRKQFSEKSILEIIFELRNRLNWPCDGILEGKIPEENEDEISTKVKLEDDGMFVYCVARVTTFHMNYYDLVYASAKKIQNLDTYFTVSASRICKVSRKEGTSMTQIYDWLHERLMYNKICNIPVFKMFRVWKSFTIWKMLLDERKSRNCRNMVDAECFVVIPQFQEALLKVQSICTALYMWKSSQSAFMSLISFDLNETYTLEKFFNQQEQHCLEMKKKIRKLHEEVVQIALKACEDYYVFVMQQIDSSMEKIKNQEIAQVVGEKVMKNYKNFQMIKEKYEIHEKAPPPDPLQVIAEKKNSNFKHIRIAHIKNLHKKLSRFLRLIDFMFVEALRNIIKNSLKTLFIQMDASMNRMKQQNLFELCDWYGLEYEKFDETNALFNIDLTLEKALNEDTSESQFICNVLPSLEDFTTQFTNFFKNIESTFLCGQTLISNDNLQKYVGANITGESETNIAKYRNWPNVQLIFESDVIYQDWKGKVISCLVHQVKNVMTFSKNYLVFCDMISHSLPEDIENSLQQEWTSHQYYEVLKKYTDQVESMKNMSTSHRLGMFQLCAEKFKTKCLPYPEKIISIVNEYLPIVAVTKIEKLITVIKNGERELSKAIDSVDDFVVHLTFVSKLSDQIPSLEQEYTAICKLFAIAFEYSANFSPEERALYQTLGPSFRQMKSQLMYCEAMKDENIQRFSHDLESILEAFAKKLHNLSNQITNPSLIDEDMNAITALETLGFLKDDLIELSAKVKSFAEYEVVFKSALSATVKKRIFRDVPFQKSKSETRIEELLLELASMDKDLSLRCLLWESLEEWNQLQNKWNETAFALLDIVHLQKEVSRFVQTVYLLEKSLPNNTVLPALKKKIKSFQFNMPIISSLRNPALKTRHWKQITEITNILFKEDKYFTLGKLIQLDLSKYQDSILEISSQATNEDTLEQMLNKVKDFWKVTDFQLIVHTSRSVPMISGIDDILYAIDDGMVTLTNIRGSRFSTPLQNQINEWDRKLSLFLRTFEEWISLQRNWLYLENIFAAQDIQRQLPNEAKLFSQVDKTWRDVMRRTMDNPNALSAGTTAGLLEILQACNSNLEKIHRSLEEYLETKRLVFSRFYFLSNEELLDILANSKNVLAVQPYLLKCFANVKRLEFDFTQRSPFPILSMTSKEGERIPFPKSLKARGQLEHWLAMVESVMFDTIKLLIKNALSSYDDVNFISWITKQQGQISSILQQIIFTSTIESLFTKDSRSRFPKYKDTLKEKLDLLSNHVRGYMDEKLRNNAVNLIIAIVHQRDIIEKLIQQDVSTARDFEWQRVLRYLWDDEGNNCTLYQSIASFLYGYEYLGCTSRLVITPLTDRCYLTLTTAMHFHLGCSPSGPAGTGKSETVKDLAKAAGKQCLVFNCSEGLDFKMIGRYLSGLCQSGSWCCLDEFNRIDVEVLSVIAQQLHVIRSAKLSKSVRFMFEGKDIRLNSTSVVAITMNPGYAGRVDLPDNLKSLFRPISMVTPDNSLIAEIILFSNGFSMAYKFSQKIVDLYSLAKKQLSHQFHYDFGLRAIKALLILAGERMRAQISNSSESVKESAILIRAIQDSNFPKLVANDAKLFQQLLEDIFPNAFKQRSESALLEKSIGISLREMSLQRWPSQVQKVIQFYETLHIRHGVMLVGPTAGGKTTVRNILQHALNIYETGNKTATTEKKSLKGQHHLTVDMVTINPKSTTLEDLYGKFDSNTAEWNDGILSSAVRHMVNSNNQNNSKNKDTKQEDMQNIVQEEHYPQSTYQWIVLDGPVVTLWVENLNTVLDDSKLLCLANGERISLLPKMNIIFEVDSLQHASPATISRCGMIFLDPSDLGWQPYVKRWLRNLRLLNVNEELRDRLWVLLESSVDDGFTFLQKYQAFTLVKVQKLGAVQMLCNLMEGFLKYIFDNGGFQVETEFESNTIEGSQNVDHTFPNASVLNQYKNKDTASFSFQKNKELLQSLFEKLYVFCYVWAFGGHFNCYSEEAEEIDPNCHIPVFVQDSDINVQHLFDNFIHTLFENKLSINLPIGSNLIYSYYVDIEKVQLSLWDHLIKAPIIQHGNMLNEKKNADNSPLSIMESYVSTPSTVCYTFLISLLVTNQCPVLLAGVHGCGKTSLIQNILSCMTNTHESIYDPSGILGKVLSPLKNKGIASVTSLTDIIAKNKMTGNHVEGMKQKYIAVSCEFSKLTTVKKPKDFICKNLVKQSRGVLGPKNQENIILFIDDLSMPQQDEFGTQPPLEVLRNFLDCGGFFDSQSLQWKKVLGVTLLTSFTTSSLNQKENNERLLQKFSVLGLPQLSSQALHHIFHTKLSCHIERSSFSKEVCSLRSDVISTILGVFHKVSLKLKTTPTKSHYMFNLRDISKVVSGLLQATPSVIRSSDRFIELVIHEMNRVFLDRLVSISDREIFMDIAIDQIQDFIKLRWTRAEFMSHQAYFGDFFEANVPKQKRYYQCLNDSSTLQQILEDSHDRHKLSNSNITDNLIFFNDLCQHVVSTARILRQHQGHMLLLGIGGTGKKSVVKLACFLEFCEFFQPSHSKLYSVNDFSEDLKKGMLKAGVKGEKTAFFVDDHNIISESFMELISSSLNGTDLSPFFDNEVKETIIFDLKTEALNNSIDDSPDAIYHFFLNRMKNNFHLVFATSPSGSKFYKRCQDYPALVNKCTVDWYAPWPESALYIVAKKFLQGKIESNQVSNHSIIEALVYPHLQIEKLCESYYEIERRYFHVTPKSFFDFISLFAEMYNEKLSKSEYNQARLESGLQKLEDTNVVVEKMKSDLIDLGPKLEEKTKDTRLLMEEISEDTEKVNKIRSIVKEEEQVTNKEADRVERIAHEAQRDLDNALPQLEAATAALDALNKYDIGEIRSYAHPPTMVMTVLNAVCIALNEKADWPTAKQLLADPGFLKRLINYDHHNVTDKIYSKLRKYTKQDDFNPLAVGKISVACKSMCSWVIALENYVTVNRLVKPKQEKCVEAKKALKEAKGKLQVKRQALSKIEDQLSELQSRYQESMDQLKELTSSKELTVLRLQRAATLIDALTSEKDRWCNLLEDLKKTSSYILTEAIMCSSAVAYMGAFTPKFRLQFESNVKEKLSSLGLLIKENFQFVNGMAEQVQIESWINDGLPSDQHSIQNAVITENAKLWPYIIDPQKQALAWIKNKEKMSNIKVVNASSSNLMGVLEDAIRLGEIVILQNAGSTFDALLDPILSKKIIRTGNKHVLIMGDTEIQYNEKFKLYILTSLKNPKLLPEMCIRVNVINFLITKEGLNEQILSHIVQQEKPELEMQRNNLLETLVQDRYQLTELEDTSLTLLHQSEGNILDDEKLISTLERSKTLASKIKIRVKDAQETQKKIDIERTFYLPLANRGVLLYFISNGLPILNSMYQFSLAWFLDLFCKCIDFPKESDLMSERPLSARGRLDEAKKFSTSTGLSRRKMNLLYTSKNNSPTSRMELMIDLITETFYKSVSYALAAEHQLLFSFYMATNVAESLGKLSVKEYNLLLNSTKNYVSESTHKISVNNENESPCKCIDQQQWNELSHLCSEVEEFVGLSDHMAKNEEFWDSVIAADHPILCLKSNMKNKSNHDAIGNFSFENLSEFHWLLLVNIIRPDFFSKSVLNYTEHILSSSCVTPPGFDLENVFADSTCRKPIMFILSPGSDPSSQLTRFVKEVRGSTLHLDMMSLGRLQGRKAVEAIRKSYTQRGSWVFLQNCHLALSFMSQLEDIVLEIADPETQVHPQFRLWLSTRPDERLPLNILQNSLKVSVEPPPGVRSSMKNAFTSVGGLVCESFFEDTNVHENWKELVYSACLFHSVLHERRKFQSRGWNISYDFIMPDLEMTLLSLRDMVSQSDIPWGGLRLLTGNIIYGGRVTDPMDLRCLLVLLNEFYSHKILDQTFSFMTSKSYTVPSNESSYYDVIHMIDNLPGDEHAEIFGMDESAVHDCSRGQSFQLLKDLVTLRSEYFKSHSVNSLDEMTRKKAEQILSKLPNQINLGESLAHQLTKANQSKGSAPSKDEKVSSSSSTSNLEKCAIFTALSQEMKRYNNLLHVLHESLTNICRSLNGEILVTDELEEISKCLIDNNIPKHWQKHSYKSCKSLSSWLENLNKRVGFVSYWLRSKLVEHENRSSRPRAIWISSFFYPQGILTAVLQNHSRKLGKSVDQFCFDYHVTNQAWKSAGVSNTQDMSPVKIATQGSEVSSHTMDTSCRIFGIFLDGAMWDMENHVITKCPMKNRISPLPEMLFVPVEKQTQQPSKNTKYYECPLYQTSIRRHDRFTMFDNFVTVINLPTNLPPEDWVLGGVAALCQTDV